MIKQFVNPHRASNNWLITLDGTNCLLVDVGNFNQNLLLSYLEQSQKKVVALVLTHEHADHTIGLNKLLESMNVPVFCTAICAKNVGDKRQNFSHYLEDIETFEYHFEATSIEDFSRFDFHGNELEFFETPGHSPGGLILRVNRCWFTGDTILNHIKTPLNFPHSNKVSFNESLTKVSPHFQIGDEIYPGHGDSFTFKFHNQFEFCTK